MLNGISIFQQVKLSLSQTKMALFSDGGVSSPDIWIVVLMLLVALIGAVLNPLVFRHNLRKNNRCLETSTLLFRRQTSSLASSCPRRLV